MPRKPDAPNEAPPCPGPGPAPRPPSFAIPRGACAPHAPVIGAPERFPFVTARSYTPPPAPMAAYLAMLDALRMDRGVLVQVSVHGTDNRAMLEALGASPDRLRGIAVVNADASDRELETLARAGVRGVRLNTLFGGGVTPEHLERLAERIAPLGWHMQFLIDARTLPELGPRIERLPVEAVIDHMGFIPVDAGIENPGFQWLLRLLKGGRTWVKVSGTYRISKTGAPFHDATPFARALLAAAPDRCLWGSDWPHVAVTGPMFNTGDLLELLPLWAPDETLRRKVLVDNPTRLFGFPEFTD